MRARCLFPMALAACALGVTFACTGNDPNIGDGDDNDGGGTSSSGASGSSSGNPGGGDAALDSATPRCDQAKPFENPKLVPGINTTDAEISATFSGDELKVYLSRRPAGQFTGADLYVASRVSEGEAFGSVTALSVLNSPSTDDNVSTTSDALTLYFHSDRPDSGTEGGAFDIWRAQRPSINTSPLAPQPLTTINTDNFEQDPYVSGDGNTLYFMSARGAGFRIFRAEKLGGGFSAPVELELEIDAGPDVQLAQPVVSTDGKTLFVAYYESPVATPTIWSARRDNTLGAFKNFAPLPGTAFGAGKNLPTWVSPDGCHLYFRSDRPGSLGDEDIWMASRGL